MSFALGEEGGHPGLLVLGGEALAEHRVLVSDGLVGGQVILLVDALLGVAHGDGGVLEDAGVFKRDPRGKEAFINFTKNL